MPGMRRREFMTLLGGAARGGRGLEQQMTVLPMRYHKAISL